jgi:hypothetical protein
MRGWNIRNQGRLHEYRQADCLQHHLRHRRHPVSAMEPRASVVERAFQIARSGSVASVPALRAVLTQEGYTNAQVLAGRSLNAQLARMINEARISRQRTPAG